MDEIKKPRWILPRDACGVLPKQYSVEEFDVLLPGKQKLDPSYVRQQDLRLLTWRPHLLAGNPLLGALYRNLIPAA
jgi:hypothetical protein